MDQREAFVLAYLASGPGSLAGLCADFSISRPTAYKWLERYRAHGRAGLADLSRAPLHHPFALDEQMRARVLGARQLHPCWGPRKLLAWLARRHPQVADWPAASTVGDLLRREGLVAPRRRRAHATPSVHPLTDGVEPNDEWCADFKGWWRTADGARCEPLTISDHATRFLLHCHAPRSTRGADVQPLFAATFAQFGLPRVIRTDNGAPFGSVGLLGLSRLSVWLMRLGIVPERIEPAHPEQNGRHERLHKTLKDQLAAGGPPRRVQRHLRDAQRELTAFMREYNDERPHEALGNQTPAQLYTRSPRPLPRRLPEPQYSERSHKRTVQAKGEIKWHNNVIYIGTALAEQVVALEWIDDAWLKICFMQLELARYHAPSGRLCYADGRTAQRSTRSGRPGRLVNRNQV